MTGPTDSAGGTPALTYEILEARRLATEGRLPDDLGLRLRRSLSWLDRAEKEMSSGDHDAAFIFHWIAFNASYQKQHSPVGSPESPEREHFTEYFRRLISLDSEGAVYDAVWQRFSESIRVLLENRYVFQPFWNHLNGVPGYENWESRFAGSRRTIGNALARQNTETASTCCATSLFTAARPGMGPSTAPKSGTAPGSWPSSSRCSSV